MLLPTSSWSCTYMFKTWLLTCLISSSKMSTPDTGFYKQVHNKQNSKRSSRSFWLFALSTQNVYFSLLSRTLLAWLVTVISVYFQDTLSFKVVFSGHRKCPIKMKSIRHNCAAFLTQLNYKCHPMHGVTGSDLVSCSVPILSSLQACNIGYIDSQPSVCFSVISKGMVLFISPFSEW